MATESTNDRIMVADLEIASVRPDRSDIEMVARGADGADYHMNIHFEMPMDRRTQTVIGELLAQSEIRIWRSVRQPLKARARKIESRQSAS